LKLITDKLIVFIFIFYFCFAEQSNDGHVAEQKWPGREEGRRESWLITSCRRHATATDKGQCKMDEGNLLMT